MDHIADGLLVSVRLLAVDEILDLALEDGDAVERVLVLAGSGQREPQPLIAAVVDRDLPRLLDLAVAEKDPATSPTAPRLDGQPGVARRPPAANLAFDLLLYSAPGRIRTCDARFRNSPDVRFRVSPSGARRTGLTCSSAMVGG